MFPLYKRLWNQKEFRTSLFFGFLLLIISLLVNRIAGIYISGADATHVHDLILDNIPVFNVNFIVNECLWLYLFFVLFFSFRSPHKIPFALKSVALFIIIRSFFVCLTHLGTLPIHSFLNEQDYLSSLASGNDLFFSGHTGMPFLLALIFWDVLPARILSLAASVIFGTTMLLGHLHYSIDIFAAFFITYTIFILAQKFFHKDALRAFPEKNPQ